MYFNCLPCFRTQRATGEESTQNTESALDRKRKRDTEPEVEGKEKKQAIHVPPSSPPKRARWLRGKQSKDNSTLIEQPLREESVTKMEEIDDHEETEMKEEHKLKQEPNETDDRMEETKRDIEEVKEPMKEEEVAEPLIEPKFDADEAQKNIFRSKLYTEERIEERDITEKDEPNEPQPERTPKAEVEVEPIEEEPSSQESPKQEPRSQIQRKPQKQTKGKAPRGRPPKRGRSTQEIAGYGTRSRTLRSSTENIAKANLRAKLNDEEIRVGKKYSPLTLRLMPCRC